MSEEQKTELDRAYEERNRLVALLARIYPSGLMRTNIDGWDTAWHNCVFIDTPVGQMSWHFHDRERFLFDGLPKYEKAWDGHTTDEKYTRVELLAAKLEKQAAAPEKTGRMPEIGDMVFVRRGSERHWRIRRVEVVQTEARRFSVECGNGNWSNYMLENEGEDWCWPRPGMG